VNQTLKSKKPSIISEPLQEKILALSLLNPAFGARRLVQLLSQQAIFVSESSVYKILRRNGQRTRIKRIQKLEELYFSENYSLTHDQKEIIEKHNPCFRERHDPSALPGQLLRHSIIELKRLNQLGTLYLHVVVDTFCASAFGMLADTSKPAVTLELLKSAVLPFYKKHQVPILTVRTTENSLPADGIESYLDQTGISFRSSDADTAKSNGFIIYFRRTLSDEFLSEVDREKSYRELERLQTDFEEWLTHYNNQRTHSGFPNMGLTPMAAFLNSKPDPGAVSDLKSSGAGTAAIEPLAEKKDQEERLFIISENFSDGQPEPEQPSIEAPPTIDTPEPHEDVESEKTKETVTRKTRRKQGAGIGLWYYIPVYIVLMILIVLFGINGFQKIRKYETGSITGQQKENVPSNNRSRAAAAIRPLEDYRNIWERDLFKTSNKESAEDQPAQLQTANLPVAKDVKIDLVGTVVSSEPRMNFAIIYDKKLRKQQIYHEGERAGDVLIKKIMRNGMIVDAGRGEEMLTMKVRKSGKTTQRGVASRPPAERQRAPHAPKSYQLNRSDMEAFLKDPEQSAKPVRFYPYRRRGETVGIRVSGIRSKSYLRKLGLRNGDVIQSINDQQINDKNQALEMIEGLAQGGRFTIQTLRRGRPQEIQINIE
jgi:type II secretion system protein C